LALQTAVIGFHDLCVAGLQFDARNFSFSSGRQTMRALHGDRCSQVLKGALVVGGYRCVVVTTESDPIEELFLFFSCIAFSLRICSSTRVRVHYVVSAGSG
jgi:hypothetical protein